MERTRTRKPTFKSQPSMAPKATREGFKPEIHWTEDPSNRLLHMQLPGFKREDIRVQLDNAGKLLIEGIRQVSDNKYLDVDQSFDVPKDTIIEKISGRFEDGRLTLILPKKVVEEREATRKAEEKEKEAILEEKPYTAEGKKEEEAIQDKKAEPFEEPTSTKEKKQEAKMAEDKKDEPTKQKPWSREEKKDEPMHEEKHTTTEEQQDKVNQKERPKSESEKKDDGPAVQEKPESGGEKKDDAPIRKEKMEEGEEEKKMERVEEKKKEDSTQTVMTKSSAKQWEKEEEPIQLMKSKIKEICADKTKDIRKRIYAWRGAEGSWLYSGSFDRILEKLNRNRKMIAVAVVAFSVGFFVSQKLRTKEN